MARAIAAPLMAWWLLVDTRSLTGVVSPLDGRQRPLSRQLLLPHTERIHRLSAEPLAAADQAAHVLARQQARSTSALDANSVECRTARSGSQSPRGGGINQQPATRDHPPEHVRRRAALGVEPAQAYS